MTVINNYQTWLALLQLVNVQQNGQIPPTVFNTWYNEVSDWYFRKLVEEFQITQVQSDLLSPFLLQANVMIAPQAGQNWGIAGYPSDYEYFANASILRQMEEEQCCLEEDLPIIDTGGKSKKYTDPDIAQMIANFAGANILERQIQLVDTARWAACLNHLTKYPSWEEPKMTQFKNGFKVSPKGLTSIVLTYLKTPQKSIFAYTVSAQDILIYDSAGSQQLEWSEQVLPVFLAELQKKYGAYIGDDKMYQMGNNDKKEL